jgi:hypothetical protein
VSTRAYACNSEQRRSALSNHPTLMGIDFLEVSEEQQELSLHFVPAGADVSKAVIPPGFTSDPPTLTADDIHITGGERITNIQVVGVDAPADQPGVLIVKVKDDDDATNGVGDFSPYTLSLVDVHDLDPLFAEVTFSFKAGCPTEFDCKPEHICPPEPLSGPEIDYLAKDYSSFRRLILDRMAAIQPAWTERNAADTQIALVELLAYVGDYLSYQQDAVATEAYLGTARRRASVRRHARLVDYPMHDGSNARLWAQVHVGADNVVLPRGTKLLTRVGGRAGRLAEGSSDLDRALATKPEVFETLHEVTLFKAHDRLTFYTWGNRECCLPRGATRATLRENIASLRVGDYLIFEEVRGPMTGEPEDADPAQRHVVRLTEVLAEVQTEDEDGQRSTEPLTDPLYDQPITEIEWSSEDALPIPLCISAQGRDAYLEDVSVARGNIVLADHGRTVLGEEIQAMPEAATMVRVRHDNVGGDEPTPIFARFHPRLREAPLTQAAPYVDSPPAAPNSQQGRLAPTASAMSWSTRDLLPFISLLDGASGTEWLPRRDLMGSGPFASEFVVEMEADGRAFLRFGDDRFGMRPAPGTVFTATYRVGNGVRGNVGAGALGHVVSNDGGVLGVRNPMPAQGGIEPESIEHVRQSAPSAFRTQERAVTPEDYARVVERHPQVQRATATARWTGSWRTIFVTVDRLGGLEVDAEFEKEMRLYLDGFRMAGHDIELDNPRFVFLEVEMHACVEPDYFHADVKSVLLDVFSDRAFPDGRRGVFHPDNFTFGQPVHLSPLYAAAQAVEGVASVEIIRLQRLRRESRQALDDGFLSVGRLEVARLDNDPNFPERGIFNLTVEGGK